MRKQLIAFLFLLFIGACGPATTPCGVFTFNGTPISRGLNLTQSFQFGPSPCAATCTTNTIAYIQVIRVIDQNDGSFLAPGPEQQARIVTGNATPAFNGWSVDRLEGRVWGYYGRNNDGTFAGTLTTGSNTSAAILRDTPSGWPDNTWLDAIDVPVCIDANSTCVNNLLGYDYWLFAVGTGGSVGNPVNEIGRDWHQDAADLAIAQWNSNAGGLGKNGFPAFTRMH